MSGREAANGPDVTLWIRADAGSIHLLRTLAAGVAADLEVGIDDVDDLRLAITEAASHLLSVCPSARRLRLDLTAQDGGMRVVVAAQGADGGGNAGDPTTLAWQVLQALTEDLDAFDGGDEYGVAFRKSFERQS